MGGRLVLPPILFGPIPLGVQFMLKVAPPQLVPKEKGGGVG